MHVMVDIESLGPRPGSVILSIGACAFDPEAGTLGAEFCVNVDPKSAVAYGQTIDPETVIWWTRQSDAARQAAFQAADPKSLSRALLDFARFLREVHEPTGEIRLWGHGATFDPVLLAGACEACLLPVPWEFRNVRDTRTIFDLAGISALPTFREPEDEAHTPLSDAKVQARAVIAAYRRLRPIEEPANATVLSTPSSLNDAVETDPVICERMACAALAESHSGFWDPATIDAIATAIRERGPSDDRYVLVFPDAWKAVQPVWTLLRHGKPLPAELALRIKHATATGAAIDAELRQRKDDRKAIVAAISPLVRNLGFGEATAEALADQFKPELQKIYDRQLIFTAPPISGEAA